MSQDLLTQLAEYGTYCEERQGSVSADDILGNVVPLPAMTSGPNHRRMNAETTMEYFKIRPEFEMI